MVSNMVRVRESAFGRIHAQGYIKSDAPYTHEVGGEEGEEHECLESVCEI